MKTARFEKKAERVLSVVGNPFRIRILLAIGKGEACVCHLEAVLKKRQAYISQHLMALRKAGLLDTRREGKYVFYRVADLGVFDLVRKAGELAGVEAAQLPELTDPEISPHCCCPNCEGGGVIASSEIAVSSSSIQELLRRKRK